MARLSLLLLVLLVALLPCADPAAPVRRLRRASRHLPPPSATPVPTANPAALSSSPTPRPLSSRAPSPRGSSRAPAARPLSSTTQPSAPTSAPFTFQPITSPCATHLLGSLSNQRSQCLRRSGCTWNAPSQSCVSSTPTGPPVDWLCYNGCFTAFDGVCDDGGPGSTNDWCPYGSDCADCGSRDNVSE